MVTLAMGGKSGELTRSKAVVRANDRSGEYRHISTSRRSGREARVAASMSDEILFVSNKGRRRLSTHCGHNNLPKASANGTKGLFQPRVTRPAPVAKLLSRLMASSRARRRSARSPHRAPSPLQYLPSLPPFGRATGPQCLDRKGSSPSGDLCARRRHSRSRHPGTAAASTPPILGCPTCWHYSGWLVTMRRRRRVPAPNLHRPR